MLIVVLFILSIVKVNGGPVDQDGLRKSRQLDLGLQDIRPTDDEIPTTVQLSSDFKNDITSGYLPPVSPPEFVSSQSQQAFDYKSASFVEKESKLCKSPFDDCYFKEISTSDSKIPKPSRDLVPPFNDLEKEPTAKDLIHLEEAKEQKIKTTTIEYQNKDITTTEKTAVKTSKRVPSSSTTRFITTTLRPKLVENKADATNELRSYLPPQPEFSAAAQTNVAVVQPANQNRNSDDHHHHHHHGHHHGDDFNICADAFHSFLCAPLKARKRITGAIPESLKGQSSFINYQKSLLNFDKDTAPSNTFRNEYLPPNLSSTNLIQSTYLPPLTTKRPITTTTTTVRPYFPPKITSEFSNSNDRFHLPPLPDNRIIHPSVVKPAFSNQEKSTIKPSTTLSPITFSKTTSSASSNSFFQKISPAQNTGFPSPTTAVFNSVASNENRFYLPPNPNPQPSASFISTSQNIFPVTSTLSSSPATVVTLPTITTFAPLSSNSIFIPEKPKVLPTIPVFTTTTKTTIFTTTSKPIKKLSSSAVQPSKPIGSYVSPVPKSQSPSTTTTKPYSSTSQSSEQSSNTDRSYLPPDAKEPAAAQISSAAVAAPQVKNPFHHGRDLCTDPFHSFLCVSAKPRKRITGQIPLEFKPDSSNTDESRLKPEPPSQKENKVRPEHPLEGAPAQNLGYKYPKPINPFPTPTSEVTSSTARPSSGYSYPKPDKIFSLPSQENLKFTPATSSTTKTPEPVPNPSETKVVPGYQNTKPDKIIPLPAEQENAQVTITTTTTSSPTTGYSYPRPPKPFPLPTAADRQKIKQKTTSSPAFSTSSPASQVKGYQYPRPDQSLKLPEKKGYSYPKPEKPFELPNENRSKFLLPQSNSNLDDLKNLGSADFIPVNKLDYKRAEPSKLLVGLRRFGERMKKRERQAQLLKRQLH